MPFNQTDGTLSHRFHRKPTQMLHLALLEQDLKSVLILIENRKMYLKSKSNVVIFNRKFFFINLGHQFKHQVKIV